MKQHKRICLRYAIMILALLACFALPVFNTATLASSSPSADKFNPAYAEPANIDPDIDNAISRYLRWLEKHNMGKKNISKGNERVCAPFARFEYEDGTGLLCTADWAGNPNDIWVVFPNPDGTWARPLFTGRQLDLKAEEYQKYWSKLSTSSYSIKESIADIKGDTLYLSFRALSSALGIDNHTVDTETYVDLGTGAEFEWNSFNFTNKPVKFLLSMKYNLEEIRKDSDGDGLTDILERRFATDENNPDTDQDGVPDIEDGNPHFSNREKSEFCDMYDVIAQNLPPLKSKIFIFSFPNDKTCSYESQSLTLGRGGSGIELWFYIKVYEPVVTGDNTATVIVMSATDTDKKPKVTEYYLKKNNAGWVFERSPLEKIVEVK